MSKPKQFPTKYDNFSFDFEGKRLKKFDTGRFYYK